MMAKRAIEEEFDRLYSNFIENPEALPRLKKRVKRCRQLTGEPQTSASCEITCKLSSKGKSKCTVPVTTKCAASARAVIASVVVSSERGISRQPDVDTQHLQRRKLTATFTVPASSSPPVTNSDDQKVQTTHQPSVDDVTDDVISTHDKDDDDITAAVPLKHDEAANDVFTLHKPRLHRVQCQQKSLNLDALWALYAKTWLLPKHPATIRTRHPVYLQRNLQRGCISFKIYLNQQKALKDLSKSSHQHEPEVATAHLRSNLGKKGAAVKTSRTKDASSYYQDKNKLKQESGDGRVQKRKDVKPKPNVGVSKKPNQAKMDASNVRDKRSDQDADTKTKAVKSERLAMKTDPQRDSQKVKTMQTRKQSLKKEDTSTKKPLTTPSTKQVWPKEISGERQVAICRPNTKRKASKADAASNSDVKMKCLEEEKPKRQLPSAEPRQEKAQAFTASKDTTDTAEESGEVGGGGGIKPLFSGGHCGGIWKSIVDEC